MAPSERTLEQIRRLVSFDTVSRNSNLALIEHVRDSLADLGVESALVGDESGEKANLYATIGPPGVPGIALSGHTDVVPVDDQDWDSDPFEVVERDGRLFGRGTADMKSFIAATLAALPSLVERDLETPIHLAFSFDEEIGCKGVRHLLGWLAERPVRPRGVIVGEPTGMEVVRAHKGKVSFRCHVHGRESHSGLAHLGVNAVEAAAEAVAFLKRLARRYRDDGPFDEELTPPYTTVHTGVIRGGTQVNIVPRHCSFDFEFRHLPADDPDRIFEALTRHLDESLLPEMRAVDPDARFEFEPLSRIPGLAADESSEIVQLALALTGRNRTGKVSFGTEGGLFERDGMPAVVCGPGHIAQAHKPNEFIALTQIAECERFLARLFDRCAR